MTLTKNITDLDIINNINSIDSSVLNNFIPSGTTIAVKTDGTGDYTKLSDALSYITHKWSNGNVTINLGSGTFTETSAITLPEFNIPKLTISGVSIDSTIVQGVGVSAGGFITSTYNNSEVIIQNICFKNTDTSISGSAICAYNGGNFTVVNCKSVDFRRGIVLTQQDGSFCCRGTLTIENTTATNMQGAIWCNAGNIYFPNGTIVKAKNISYGFTIGAGGFVRSNGLIFNINSVTNRYNITRNTVQEGGMILGTITEGTY